MKRVLVALLAISMAAGVLTGCGSKGSEKTFTVGFLKGNDELRDTVQKTLDEMAADGTFTQIAEKWGLTDSVCLGK